MVSASEHTRPTKRNRYSENLRRADQAASYNTKYEREFHKRLSDSREKRLLGEILETIGRQPTLLDVPCGAGRLSGVLSRYADRVFEVDYSLEMAKLCRTNAAQHGYEPILANASALQLPFPARSFDLVVSIRLSHHFPAREERLQHIEELLRVSRRFVLVTFFGTESLKNRLRRLKIKLGSKKRGKYTLHHDEVRATAAAAGFDFVRSWPLAHFFSGHYFALLERRDGTR